MVAKQISKGLDLISDRDQPLFYYPGQFIVVSGLAYTATSVLHATWLINVDPVHGTCFIVLAFAANKAVSPMFSEIFKSKVDDRVSFHKEKVLRWTTALILSKLTCAIFNMYIKNTQILMLGLAFMICYRVLRIGLKNFRESLAPPPINKSDYKPGTLF